jgi:hypothetical protein
MATAMSKVFVIGLSKTGTTSLTSALEILGYRALHNPEKMLELADGELRFRVEDAADWDALSDIPVAAFFEDLDAAYPGSRFILTTRGEESWLRSCENHFDPLVFRPNRIVEALVQRVYGTTSFDRERFRVALRDYLARVSRHFEHRPGDLLRIDTATPDKWKELASFLDRPVPSTPYPHDNRATPVPRPLKRLLRALRNRVRH